MIGTHSAEYKALTTAQKAKVRKAIAAYEAERNPIMFETGRTEKEARDKAYVDLNIAQRLEEVEQRDSARLAEIREQQSKLAEEANAILKARSDDELNIRTEIYTAAYNHPRVLVLHDIWKAINERHEAKMADLLSSFKAEGEVA